MTGASITITVDDAEVQAAASRLAARVGNLAPAWRNVGEYLLESTRARFRQQQAPDGTPWEPISARWLRRKVARGHDPRILIMRGHLMNWLRYQVLGQTLVWGTDRVYGAIHQFGGEIQHPERQQELYFKTRGRKQRVVLPGFVKASRANYARTVTIGAHTTKLPARPYLGLSEADRAEITAILTDFLEGTHAG